MAHPLNKDRKWAAFIWFVRWQVSSRLNPYPILYPFTERSKLLISRGMRGATGNLYCGLHDFSEMGFLLHCLRPGDVFVDVGANVGSYTILASAEVGARTVAIEPVPSTFGVLRANLMLNGLDHLVDARNIGLGGEKGTIKFTKRLGTVNHVATGNDTDTIDVPIETLDDVVAENTPQVIKIDVEGYEAEVLRGGRRALANPEVKALIVELNGSGDRYGFTDTDVHRELLASGFSPFSYDPLTRRLAPIATFGSQDTIYLRDVPSVVERVQSARPIGVRTAWI